MIRAGVRRKTENAGIGRTRKKAEERANSRPADAGRETGKAPAGSMTLQEVLSGVRLRAALPPEVSRMTVAGLEYDSRRVAAGELFFAFQGQNADGRLFAREAVKRGAPAVVSELPKPDDFTGVWIEVEHGREAMALASRNFFGAPDERIVLTGNADCSPHEHGGAYRAHGHQPTTERQVVHGIADSDLHGSLQFPGTSTRTK